jgi:AcrR family transcriptional regulator
MDMAGPLRSVPSASSPAPEPVRDVVLRAAAALLATDSGASLAEIAAAAGVGRTTVHRIFPTRADLLTALAMQAVARLQTALDAARLEDDPAPQVLARVVEEVLPLADELSFLDAGPEVWDLPQLQDAWLSVASALDSLVEAFTGILLGVWNGVRDGRVAPATATRHILTLTLTGITPPTPR